MKKVKQSFRIPQELSDKLKQCDNQTDVITEALAMYFTTDAVLVMKIESDKQMLHDLRYQTKVTELQLQRHEKELEQVRQAREFRPDNYEYSVDTLRQIKKTSGHVNSDSLEIQAGNCNVPVSVYKRWLFDDGVLEELLSL